MLFPTFDYFVFLPVVTLVHWVLGRGRTLWILAASLLFYASWHPEDTIWLALSAAVAFFGGRLVERRPGAVPLVVGALLAPLLYFKYTHFVAENLAFFFPSLPVPEQGRLPIGISFYTFQALGYVIDVRRGEQAERKPLDFGAFLLFFPHLVAGPILRAKVLLAQVKAERQLTSEDVGEGLYRLSKGLAKKMLVADVLGVGIVDTVFMEPSRFTGPEILVALYAYTLQIYCDFSGYTDFAIGSARLLGFHIPENFKRPYQALTVGEYWRRWHITLSDWVRDYVYYPLGGSRSHVYRNTFITLLILAIWHGASWTFVLYGLIHGCAVSINRAFRRKSEEPLRFHEMAWRWALTFNFVVLARILFRADTIEQAGQVAQALGMGWDQIVMPRFSPHSFAVLILGYLVHLSPMAWGERLQQRFARLPAPALGLALVLVAWACVSWGVGDSLTFVYYEF